MAELLRYVLCKCHACIVPVGSKKYNIYAVASLLEEKGWNLATGQSPPCLTICIGERHDRIWVDFKELNLSYYIGESILNTIYIYTYYGSLLSVPEQQPRNCRRV